MINLCVRFYIIFLNLEILPLKMRNVFFNLLTNAIKYSDPNSDIEVEGLRQLGAYARIAVTNERGIGIPEGWDKEIFKRDVRAPNVKENGISGAGIGLSIVEKIVKAHDGRVFVESRTNPTTFIVELPRI